MTDTTSILKPAEFAAHIEDLTDRVSIYRACNELLEQLRENYAVTTISKHLTSYRRELLKIENPKISETVSTKRDGNITQHLAVNLLKLSSEQKSDLFAQSAKASKKVLGFDEDGNLKEQQDIPSIDITTIVKKALALLDTNDYGDLACALLLLTGLRPTELVPKRQYEKFGIVEREMVALEGYRVAFKGLNKKRSLEDIESFFTRPSLADSSLLVKHYKRFVSLCPWNEQTPDDNIYRILTRRFIKLFAEDLSTIADFDAETGSSSKANTYKMRAFYACAVRATLIGKGMGENQAAAYLQKALGHDNGAETIRYLSKYESHRFINPIDLDIDINLNAVGKMTIQIPEKIEIIKALPEVKIEGNLNEEKFLDALDESQKIEFIKAFEKTRDLTEAILSLIPTKQKTMVKKDEKASVADRIEEIYKAIVILNEKQPEAEDCLYPSWGLIDKISQLNSDKSIAKVTYDKWEVSHKNDIDSHLEFVKIPQSDRNSLWNGKHHKRTIKVKIDEVISILKSSGNSD